MDEKQNNEKPNVPTSRFQNVIKSWTKCKIDIMNETKESKILHDTNTRLEVELKETRELEKSHRYHLMASREMIENLQETVSQLVYLKHDVKKLKDEIILKNSSLAGMEKDKEYIIKKHNEDVLEIRNAHERMMEDLAKQNEKKIQDIQHDSDTQIAQFTCAIEELRCKIKDMEIEHRDKMNVVVLEYEEKIQRGAAQVAQLQEQLVRQSTRTDANIDAYRRRLEELEEKLKQNQFKQYLAQGSYASQYESQVERPYSEEPRDPFVDLNPVHPVVEKPRPPMSENKTPRPNTLQVMYYGNKQNTPKNVAKKAFTITKKRKLYSDRDLQDF